MVMASGKRVNFKSSEGKSYAESNNICYETSLLPQAVSKHVMSGDFVLKVNKKLKGKNAWDQFCLV